MSSTDSTEEPLVTAIDHCSVIVANLDKALEVYTGILNLPVNASRPNLGYSGIWLQLANSQIHLLELPNPDSASIRPEHGGRDRHFALQVTNLELVVKRLEEAKINYSKSKSGRKALFFRDFDDNVIELVEKNTL